MTRAVIVRTNAQNVIVPGGDRVVVLTGSALLSGFVGSAKIAANVAESAAAAALAAAGVGQYANTTLGLAGTAMGETFWVDQGDGTGQVYRHDSGPVATPLQSFIIDPQASGAAGIIGSTFGTVQSAIAGIANLRQYGADADNNSGVWAAIVAAQGDGFEVLRLDYVPGESNIAYFETFTPSALVGCTLDIDPRITLSLPSNEPAADANAKLIRYVNPPNFYFRSLSVPYAGSRDGGAVANDNGARRVMPYVHPKDVDHSIVRRVLASTLTPLKRAWPSGTWGADAFADTSTSSFVFTPGDDDSDHVGFFNGPKPGDEFSASFGQANAPDLEAVVRFVGGDAGVRAPADYSSIPQKIEKLGASAGTASDINLVGPGTHETYSGMGAVWTIRIDSWYHFTILWNGMKVLGYQTAGMIESCGFGMLTTGASQVIAAQNQTRRYGGPTESGQFRSMAIYGDSLWQERYDDAETYLRNELDSTCGIRLWKTTNQAVGGHGIGNQLAIMEADQTSGLLAQHDIVLIALGTNDIQALTDITQFRTDFTAAIDLAQGVGADVVVCIPPVFYGQGQAGPRGQPATNYGRRAPYITTILDVIAQKDSAPSSLTGRRCIPVDLPRVDGPVVAHYVNDSPLSPDMRQSGDPVKYDNTHSTTATNQRYADVITRAVARLAVPYSGSLYLERTTGGGALGSGVTLNGAGPKVKLSADGIRDVSGALNVPADTNDVVIYTWPKRFWVDDTLRRPPIQSDLPGNPYAWLSESNGEVRAYGFTNEAWVDLSCLSGHCIEDRPGL